MEYEQADRLNRAIRLIGIKHRARAGAFLNEFGLHPGQEVLLLELAALGARTQAQVATGLGCEPPTVTVMARKLVAAGLVSRRTSPEDARLSILELTDAGWGLVPRLKARWLELAESTVSGLTVMPVELLISALNELTEKLLVRWDGGGDRGDA